MAITRTAMVDDDGSGTTGTVLNNAWKTELYNQIDGLGTWVPVPYAAGNFTTGSAMTWLVEAGDVLNFSYTVIGHVIIVSFNLNGTTIGGTVGDTLRLGGLPSLAANTHAIGRYNPGGPTFNPALFYTLPAQGAVYVTPLAGGNFVAGNVTVQGSIISQI